jgi:small-conductance mechanosensitive channel
MKFEIGDKVRTGTHFGTVTDVGTVLIQVRTNEGTSRVVCPWELVPVRALHDAIGSELAPE